jgi:hypothetical protein
VGALTCAVVGVCPNGAAIFRLAGAILLELNYEWAVQRGRYMTLEPIATLSDAPLIGQPAVVILPTWSKMAKAVVKASFLRHAWCRTYGAM